MDLCNDLGFSLCAALSVYHVVATSDDGEKFKMKVSADWYVTVEHQCCRLKTLELVMRINLVPS